MTVAPRDTVQQGNDSESASISAVSRRNAELFAEQAGCVGYETGGAQYQARPGRGTLRLLSGRFTMCFEDRGKCVLACIFGSLGSV